MTIPLNPVEHLYFGAKFQPDDAAIHSAAGEVTWRRLLAIVRSIAYKLRQTGVRANQLAVTYLSDAQLDWIVTLALMHEAVATCSTPGPIPLELEPDHVLTTIALPHVPHSKMILLDDQWLKELPQVAEDFGPQRFASRDSPFRLILTSGTTGQLKAAEFSLDTLVKRCERLSARNSIHASELCMMGVATVTGFTVTLRALMRGITSFLPANDAAEIVRLINAYHIECLSGSPHQLTAVLEEMQRTSRRLSSLKLVWYVGGEASPTLLSNMRRDLCPTVLCLYGSTEVGTVSYCQVHDPNQQPGMAGYVVPEAEVQIVNEERRPLHIGEEGAIRVRSSAMARGYYKNPAETNRSYRDGWFYPGDRGKLLTNGMLVVTGREHELINRGGARVSPADIDFLIRRFEGIRDAAAFGFENHLGLEDICAAVVVADDFQMEPFQRQLAQTLPPHQNPSLILKLNEIPRNQMGKPMRSQMRQEYGEMLRQRLKKTG